jgi:predicted TIM-barrel fold metal-dependent hydrolase
MMHQVAAEAGRLGLPLVFHTGMLWGGHADIARTRPGLLHNLFDAFPDTRFAILHAAPYEGEAAYLCAMFANVHLDFTWTAMLSPTRFRGTFNQWIESIPQSKFMWGSDSSSPEAHLGVTLETRELVADILCDRVRQGLMSESSAYEFARGALSENARRFYLKTLR